MTPESFKSTFGPSCVAAMLKNGGFASVRMAQIALESAWGEAVPTDIYNGRNSFNLTGVKGVGPAGYVWSWTEEYDPTNPKAKPNGYVDEIAKFRAYESFDQHITERDRIFLDWPSNYGAYLAAKTPEEACWALQNAPLAYATDPSYASKLIVTIEANDFKRFDRYLFVDVGPDHRFYGEIKAMKDAGYVRGESDGRLGLPDEAIRVLVITRRMIEAKR